MRRKRWTQWKLKRVRRKKSPRRRSQRKFRSRRHLRNQPERLLICFNNLRKRKTISYMGLQLQTSDKQPWPWHQFGDGVIVIWFGRHQEQCATMLQICVWMRVCLVVAACVRIERLLCNNQWLWANDSCFVLTFYDVIATLVFSKS